MYVLAPSEKLVDAPHPVAKGVVGDRLEHGDHSALEPLENDLVDWRISPSFVNGLLARILELKPTILG